MSDQQATSKTPYIDAMIAAATTLRDQVLAVDLAAFDNDETFQPAIPLVHKVVGVMSDEAKRLYVIVSGMNNDLVATGMTHIGRCGTPQGDADHVRIRDLDKQIEEMKEHLWNAVRADLPEGVRDNKSLGIREGGQITIDLDGGRPRRSAGPRIIAGSDIEGLLAALIGGSINGADLLAASDGDGRRLGRDTGFDVDSLFGIDDELDFGGLGRSRRRRA